MQPKPRACIGPMTAWMSSMGVTMCVDDAGDHRLAVERAILSGGPPSLLTRMSTPRARLRRAGLALCFRADIGGHGDRPPVAVRMAAAVTSSAAASRPLMTTAQPTSASASAQARPSPSAVVAGYAQRSMDASSVSPVVQQHMQRYARA